MQLIIELSEANRPRCDRCGDHAASLPVRDDQVVHKHFCVACLTEILLAHAPEERSPRPATAAMPELEPFEIRAEPEDERHWVRQSPTPPLRPNACLAVAC